MSVYNAKGFIDASISSIINQTFNDLEFIIVNDGSTDNSLEIIKSYDDNRIKPEVLFYGDIVGKTWEETKKQYIKEVGR